MKRSQLVTLALTAALVSSIAVGRLATAEVPPTQPDPRLAQALRTVKMLDQIYKTTIVLVTDKYVNEPEDFAAGSAAVLLFKQISEGGSHQVRLIDATGEPYEPKNAPQDDFEKTGIQKLKAGAPQYEQVTQIDGKDVLRVLTAVPVVMEKCTMCHENYKQVKAGAPIGAISYKIPLE